MIRKATLADTDQTAEIFLQLHELHVKAKPSSFRTVPVDFFRDRLQWYAAEENAEVLVSDENGINAFAAVRIFDVTSEEKCPRRVCYIDCFAVD